MAVEDEVSQSEHLFSLLKHKSTEVPGSDRREVLWNKELLFEANHFQSMIDAIEEEIVFESGLFSLDSYQLKVVEEHLEMIQIALGLFNETNQLISWVTEDKNDISLVVGKGQELEDNKLKTIVL